MSACLGHGPCRASQQTKEQGPSSKIGHIGAVHAGQTPRETTRMKPRMSSQRRMGVQRRAPRVLACPHQGLCRGFVRDELVRPTGRLGVGAAPNKEQHMTQEAEVMRHCFGSPAGSKSAVAWCRPRPGLPVQIRCCGCILAETTTCAECAHPMSRRPVCTVNQHCMAACLAQISA
jgi:hypothetical protein